MERRIKFIGVDIQPEIAEADAGPPPCSSPEAVHAHVGSTMVVASPPGRSSAASSATSSPHPGLGSSLLGLRDGDHHQNNQQEYLVIKLTRP